MKANLLNYLLLDQNHPNLSPGFKCTFNEPVDRALIQLTNKNS